MPDGNFTQLNPGSNDPLDPAAMIGPEEVYALQRYSLIDDDQQRREDTDTFAEGLYRRKSGPTILKAGDARRHAALDRQSAIDEDIARGREDGRKVGRSHAVLVRPGAKSAIPIPVLLWLWILPVICVATICSFAWTAVSAQSMSGILDPVAHFFDGALGWPFSTWRVVAALCSGSSLLSVGWGLGIFFSAWCDNDLTRHRLWRVSAKFGVAITLVLLLSLSLTLFFANSQANNPYAQPSDLASAAQAVVQSLYQISMMGADLIAGILLKMATGRVWTKLYVEEIRPSARFIDANAAIEAGLSRQDALAFQIDEVMEARKDRDACLAALKTVCRSSVERYRLQIQADLAMAKVNRISAWELELRCAGAPLAAPP